MPTPLDLAYMFVTLVFGYVVGFVAGRVAVHRQREEDAVLMIKPPRRFVDPDGRSDFRPELRAAAESARTQSLRSIRGEREH